MRSVLLAAMFMVYALEFHVAGVRYGFAALSVVNAVVAVREWRREVFVGADGVVIRRVMSPVRAAFGDIARFSLVDLKVRGADADEGWAWQRKRKSLTLVLDLLDGRRLLAGVLPRDSKASRSLVEALSHEVSEAKLAT